jgi:hypothetical protein
MLRRTAGVERAVVTRDVLRRPPLGLRWARSPLSTDRLGELDADTPCAERTRETLLAWLSTGPQTSAAARLGIHLNSMTTRLRHPPQATPYGPTGSSPPTRGAR